MDWINRLAVNMADVVSFGPQILLRHVPRLTGAPTAAVEIPGIGPIHLRAGESDVAALRQVFRNREYDFADIRVETRVRNRYAEIVGSGEVPVIIDAGANIGAASLWFLKEFPLASIVAIEPEPTNISVLRKNAAGKARLMILEGAVGSTSGFVSVQSDGLSWAARTVRAQAGIPIFTMAEAFQRVSNGRPFIAKIDIEGFEADLFSQNVDWIKDVYVIFIEPHDWMLPGKMTSRAFQQALAEHRFEIFLAGGNLVYVRV